MNFTELGLAESLLRAVQAEGYETATPIQSKAIPVVLAGKDVIGCAQTGTGKTAAFTLPMLDRLMQSLPARAQTSHTTAPGRDRGRSNGRSPNPRAIRALVLSPTRELAAQIGESLRRYGHFTPLRQTVVYGGVSQHQQVKALRHGVDTLVATPGRLLDLMDQGYIDLSKLEILVFDEADRMLDMGFLPALKRIVAAVPEQRQTLMFSATMPTEIRQLAQKWLIDPVAIKVAPIATPADRITQLVHLVDKKRKSDLLTRFLQETQRSRTLVFSRTKHGADKIVRRLQKEGLHAAAIHSNKSQNARSRTLAQFKSKNPPVLVATDIAARGLDIDDISHVVNFDLPDSPETYVHRIGRTARAGAEGVAVSFCAGDERGLLRQIERLIQCAITVAPPVDGFQPTDKVEDMQPGKRSRQSGGSRSPSRFKTGVSRRSPRKPTEAAGSAGASTRRSVSGGTSSGRRQATGATRSAVASPPRKRRRRRALSQ